MIDTDRAELKALIVELIEEIRLDALGKLTGAPLEFQSASEGLHKSLGDLISSFIAAGTTSAASVMVMVFKKMEALVVDMTALHASIELLAQRIDAGDTRLIDARQEGTILRDIANEERDASTSQVDRAFREIAAIKARVADLETWLGPVIRSQRKGEGE